MVIKKAISRLFKGVAKGTGEATLIPSIAREVGKITKARNLAKYGNKFDLNGDGNVNLKDVALMPWESIGKVLAICLVLILAERFKVLDYLIYLLHAVNELIPAAQGVIPS